MNASDHPRSPTAAALQAMMAQQAARHDLVQLDAAAFDGFAAGPGERVILFAEDPARVPESWDALVVLPELLKLQPGRLKAGVPDLAAARQYAPRFGITRLPALLFLRNGAYVGVIEGLRDWGEYAREFAAMAARPAGRAPLALRAGPSVGCH